LKHVQLEEHINNSSIGPLLPEEDLKRLEEQYFSYKEVIQFMTYFRITQLHNQILIQQHVTRKVVRFCEIT